MRVEDMFPDFSKGKIRTLGFYQPFATLMLHGKVETRWVRKGKKPPFPLGRYLFYATQKDCTGNTLYDWCGNEIFAEICKTIGNAHPGFNGFAIATGDLYAVKKLMPSDRSFVKFIGQELKEKKGEQIMYEQWALHFENVQAIEPFEWKFGKQGVGFVPDSELSKIISLTPKPNQP